MPYPVIAVTLPTSTGTLVNGKLTPCQLTPMWFPGWDYLSLHPNAKRAFEALFVGVLAEFNIRLTASSPGDAYRSLQLQETVFFQRYTDTYLPLRNVKEDQRTYQGKTWYKRKGVAAVSSPGRSNHGLGIALDVAIWNGSKAVGITSNAAVFNWILAHAHEYGLSWESQSEPWHLRYVCGDAIPQKVLDVERWFASLK